jgi:hypothetical protein
MAPVFRSIARLFTLMTIVFGVRPPVGSWLDVLQWPSICLYKGAAHGHTRARD